MKLKDCDSVRRHGQSFLGRLLRFPDYPTQMHLRGIKRHPRTVSSDGELSRVYFQRVIIESRESSQSPPLMAPIGLLLYFSSRDENFTKPFPDYVI
jgi:hypothetical protein